MKALRFMTKKDFHCGGGTSIDWKANQCGFSLTGGIGTTIFYLAGSILVAAAVILLVTKRRMGVND